jgi:hypothetical protein
MGGAIESIFTRIIERRPGGTSFMFALARHLSLRLIINKQFVVIMQVRTGRTRPLSPNNKKMN